ncbi:MAG: RHS repeat-associated core domain-containing protein [Deltaproteobacteria bacterium]|nr:RHS repeat-associated core domain-containing protein [Deltaproteobacteria bacterium]
MTPEPVQTQGSGPTERVLYIHTDHLGTALQLTDANQQGVWEGKAEPFGKTTATAVNTVYNLRFPGQYHDSKTGLDYNWFRTYDSTMGRYRETDPVGQAGGINVYQYAAANPLYWLDFDGRTVRIKSRSVRRTGPFGAHTYTEVSDASGTDSYGSYKIIETKTRFVRMILRTPA